MHILLGVFPLNVKQLQQHVVETTDPGRYQCQDNVILLCILWGKPVYLWSIEVAGSQSCVSSPLFIYDSVIWYSNSLWDVLPVLPYLIGVQMLVSCSSEILQTLHSRLYIYCTWSSSFDKTTNSTISRTLKSHEAWTPKCRYLVHIPNLTKRFNILNGHLSNLNLLCSLKFLISD